MAWGEVDVWEWVYTSSFVMVYQHAMFAVAVAAHHLVRPLAKHSLMAEKAAYLVLCYVCTTHFADLVKDMTGVASAGPFPHFFANCCSVLVFWRFMELFFETAPVPPSSGAGSVWLFAAFVAMPAVEIRFTPSGRPEVPRQGWLQRRSLTVLRDVLCCMAVGTFGLQLPWLVKSYAFAILLASILSCLGQGPMMFLNMLGVEAVEPMRDPCWKSQGVNDFWGRRWNLTVHSFLRRLFFAPLLKHTGSRALATFCVFLASALFHEHLVYLLFKNTTKDRKHLLGSSLGKQTAFFLVQAVLCWVERRLQRRFPGVVRHLTGLPRWVQTLLTAAVITPTGFLFSEPYEAGGLAQGMVHHFPRWLF